MTSDQNLAEVPKEHTPRDLARLGLDILAGFIHAGALLNYLITPPLEKRRNEWLDDLGTRLIQLEKENPLKI